MRILTEYWTIPDRSYEWSAIDADTYDGAGRNQVGYGRTEAEAIANLLKLIDEMDEMGDLAEMDLAEKVPEATQWQPPPPKRQR